MGAASTIAGKNLGAEKPERAARGVALASRIGLVVAAVVGTAFVLIPEVLLGVFGMTEPLVMQIGTQLLRYLSVSGFLVTIALSYTGGLQGTGDTRSPLFISIVSQILVPIGICIVLQSTRSLRANDIWLAIVLGHFTRAALSVWRFRQERWRDIEVEMETPQSLSPRGGGREARERAGVRGRRAAGTSSPNPSQASGEGLTQWRWKIFPTSFHSLPTR
jgi:Na+-driven multidrug efflux pump